MTINIYASIEDLFVTSNEVESIARALFESLPEGETMEVDFGSLFYTATNKNGSVECSVFDYR